MSGVAGIGTTVGVLVALVTLLGLLVKELGINRRATIEQMNKDRESDRVRIERIQKDYDGLREEHLECRKENRECERRVATLVHAMEKAKIDVPFSIWSTKESDARPPS